MPQSDGVTTPTIIDLAHIFGKLRDGYRAPYMFFAVCVDALVDKRIPRAIWMVYGRETERLHINDIMVLRDGGTIHTQTSRGILTIHPPGGEFPASWDGFEIFPAPNDGLVACSEDWLQRRRPQHTRLDGSYCLDREGKILVDKSLNSFS